MVAAALAQISMASSAPSPLEVVYATNWRLSTVGLTEVLAVYAVSGLLVLLLTGSLADAIGRKPVILSAGMENVSMVLYLLWARASGSLA
jgi:hypothetical protein